MKKHNIIALVGVLALTANLLIPGLAFGQVTHTGQATIGCVTTAPSFSSTGNTLNFYTDGSSTNPTQSASAQNVFTAPDGAGEGQFQGGNLEISDVRDVRGTADCSNAGVTVTAEVTETDGDDHFFDQDGTTTDPYIPAETLRLVTTTAGCPVGTYTANAADDLCYSSTTICNDNDDLCDGLDFTGNASLSAGASTAFTTYSTYSGVTNSDLVPNAGTETPAIRTLLTTDPFYGEIFVSTPLAVEVPALQVPGVYQTTIEFTVTAI